MQPDFGGKPFILSHYLAIKSAIALNNPDNVFFYYCYEPTGIWWDKTKPLVTLEKVAPVHFFMGQPILHFAHQSDVIRLLALKEKGGIYMDLDTISVQPLTPLLHNKFVIGKEASLPFVPKNKRQAIKYRIKKILGLLPVKEKEYSGFCNAVLLSEKNGDFVNIWLESYQTFRSKGRDKYWNEHSVIIPQQLCEKHPDLVTVLDPYAFHFPLYDAEGLASMFLRKTAFPHAYLHHLWESFSWEPYLSTLTVENILQDDTTYNCYARKFI
jgi:hypothetical protein